MKRILSLLLCLMLLGSSAMAEIFLDGGEDRHITFEKAGLNDPIEGLSPTTGRILSKVFDSEYEPGFAGQAVSGRYLPLLIQIDNTDGGIGYKDGKATGNRNPWGAQYVDVVYETPLYRQGNTRLTFLFSDMIPDAVGPSRSARAFHAWLREEWDCAFAFYGQQSYQLDGVNVPEIFASTGADKKADKLLLFSGTSGGKAWKQYYDHSYTMLNGYLKKRGFPEFARPHHVNANAAAMINLVPLDFVPANHTWLFTDEPLEDGDDAEDIYITWGHQDLKMYNSILEWDEDDECYYRYMLDVNGKDHLYTNLGYGEVESKPITFNNIIVQFTEMEWPRTDAPKPTVFGTGNADYFMNGKHISGVWNRDTYSDRTVFYNEDGEEIELQRGRTLIIVMDYATEMDGIKLRSISYE